MCVIMQDGDGNIALIKACRNGHVETARVLLDHKANIDYQNNVNIVELTDLELRCGVITFVSSRKGEHL